MSNAATCTRVKIDQLVVDGRYQRPVQEQRVERIIRDFDPKLLGTLELSARKNGTFAVIDGQHRYEAVKKLGRKTIPALVHGGLTVKQEADLFARTNMGRKPLTPIQRFRAQVFSGDPDAVALSNLITANGFKVDFAETSQALGVIRGIVTLENALKQHGQEHVNLLLDVVRDLWFGESAATDNNLLRGMSHFLVAYGDRFDETHRERLRRTPALTIVRRAKEKTITDSRTAIAALIADDLRRLSGLRGKPRPAAQRDDSSLSELVAADA
jgi:hypothetical protein